MTGGWIRTSVIHLAEVVRLPLRYDPSAGMLQGAKVDHRKRLPVIDLTDRRAPIRHRPIGHRIRQSPDKRADLARPAFG